MDSLPVWKSEENGSDKMNELKYAIKKIISQLVSIPDAKNLED